MGESLKKTKDIVFTKAKRAEVFFIYNVLVFFGGKSPEREISIITGLLTLNSVSKEEYNAIPVYVHSNGSFYTGEQLKNVNYYKNFTEKDLQILTFKPGEPTVILKKGRKSKRVEVYSAILCMHGRGGEDGTLAGLLRLCEIPFVGPDVFSSALAIDKDFTKIVLNGLGVENVEYLRISRENFFNKSNAFIKYASKKIGYPMIIKPARLGSSIGIKKIKEESELFAGLCEAFNYDDKIICEKFIEGARDINCAVYKLKNKFYVSLPEEAFHKSEILSFSDKYGGGDKTVGNSREVANLKKEKTNEIKSLAKKIYRKLDFSSIVRFDFLVTEEKIYLNEINAIPGSLAYYLFCSKLSEFSALLTELIKESKDRKRKEDNYVTYYSSNVLSGDFSGVKK